jgi:N-sulfoglucosamine sulfohydrolase
MPQQRVASKRQGGFYRRGRWAFAFLLTLLFAAEAVVLRGDESDQQALNVVFILADDLGWGELGSYGQTKIPTPHLDRLASEGMRFTQHYSGAPVCAPARCVLMTGKHLGKAEIRGNRQARATFPEYTEGQHPLSEDAITLATRFREAGYATGAMGKWGLGPVGSTGDPNRHGFDLFFGYNCQAVAHSYYPPHLWRNEQRIEINSRPIPGHQRQPEGPVRMEDWIGETYAPARMMEEAEQFIAQNRERPFFLYLPFIEPHVAIHPPRESVERFPEEWDSGVYRGENNYLPHPRPRAGYAAMISDLDQHVGRILAKLEREGLADRTLVVFTSDNGPTHPGRAEASDFHVGGADPPFFDSTRDLRGFKGSVYEGGLRVPMIVRLPGKIPSGTVSDMPGYFADWFPTLCEAVGLEPPEELSGESLWNVMLGGDAPESRKPMVWVFPEYGGQVAVRIGDFKVVRQRLRTQNPGPWEVYDLSSDRSEQRDLADERQDIIDKAIQILKDETLPNEHFPVPIPELAGREAREGTSLVSAGESRRPNILFLFADDQCFRTIGALGQTDIDTPNLDRLVRRGTTFTHAYNMGSFSPAVCVASRAMLVSGQMLWQAESLYPRMDEERTAGRLWPQLLAGQGYATYFTGKWHVQASARDAFHVARNVRGGMPKDVPEGYDRPHAGKPDAWSPSDPRWGGFWEGGTHWSEVVADDAVGFLSETQEAEDPFFLYVAFNAPHDPRQSPREFIERYPLERIAVPASFLPVYPHHKSIGCPPSLRDEKLAPFPRTEYAVQVHRQEYYAMITHMDEQIGRILDQLEKTGQEENTWIFFTADHGLAVGKHGLFGKQNMYDHSLRVPFLVVGPDVPSDQKTDAPIYLQDVMPTTLEIAGLEVPEWVAFDSLLPHLREVTTRSTTETGASASSEVEGRAVTRRDAIYGAYLDRQRAVIQDGWKLIVYPEADVVRLYHLVDDPEELHDVAEDPKFQDRRRQLWRKLLELQDELQDPLDLSKQTHLEARISTSAERPNILWITSEDNSPYLGCYGDPLAQTPHLDQLAREGVRYRHAFANAPVCSTARTTLITGMYATSLGAQHHRSRVTLPAAFQLYPTHLRAAGYYCTNNAKTDYNLAGRHDVWDESSRQAHYRNRGEGQPFFAIFNLMVSHEGQVAPPANKQAFRIPPEEFPLPPFHPDTPEIRRDWAHYYDQMTVMDRQVGELLEELDREGLSEDTIVFYYSDHGGALPRGKRNIHDSGTLVPLIIRIPDKWKSWAPAARGEWVDDVVSFVDLPATLLSLAGVPVPEHYEGRPFLGDQRTPPREFAYLYRGRMDERYDMVRAVRDAGFRYIRNYSPHRPWGQYYSYPFQVQPSMRSWYAEYVAGRCNPVQSSYWEPKPGEEFYRIEGDPWELENRLEEPELQDQVARMRTYLRDEIMASRDAGFIPEGMMERLAGPRTIYDYVQSDAYPLEEIVELADRASDGQVRHLPDLIAALDSPHPVLRYWGATGCLILQEQAAPARTKLLELLDDEWGDVRVVAAEGVAYLGEQEQGIRTIEAVLSSGSSYEVLGV